MRDHEHHCEPGCTLDPDDDGRPLDPVQLFYGLCMLLAIPVVAVLLLTFC